MKKIGLFCVVFLLVFAACKSKKKPGAKQKSTSNEAAYQRIGSKVNIPLHKEDNIKLYSFVADWLGTRHVLGKCSKSGVDCSCFVKLLFDEVYQKTIPRTASEMHDVSKRLEKRALSEGDLVFFNIKSHKASHVGVYLKDGWFAHVSTSKGVMINNLSEKYYAQYYLGGGRL
jgi:cell wall-associated NlpC family hydrolase